MAKTKLTIAVTGLNNTDNPGPGIPVIRAIRESQDIDVRIIGLAYENLEPGIYMEDMVDKTYQVPYPSSGAEIYLERLKEVHEKEKLDMIIPNFDAELFTFISAEKELSEWGIQTFIPTREQYEERHKFNLDDFGEKYDIKVPKSKAITSLNDIPSLRDEFDYPLLVKGKFYDAYLAYNSEQVISHFNRISAKWGLPIIIQEFVKGTEVNVVALGDGDGNTVAAVPMRKTFITDKGKAWGGITIGDEQLLKITRQLIQRTKWRGALELEIIKDNNNSYYLIEINPRIPAWVYLAVGAGQNIPEMLVKLAKGLPITPTDQYKKGKMFIRYSYDLIGDISQFEQLSIHGEL
ncbi:MAG: ATP-grasp domain-containing protein [Bacteroidales bacterium]|nr:ATP-grasp domain-containing protein [Bacteroidales bacterium]